MKSQVNKLGLELKFIIFDLKCVRLLCYLSYSDVQDGFTLAVMTSFMPLYGSSLYIIASHYQSVDTFYQKKKKKLRFNSINLD